VLRHLSERGPGSGLRRRGCPHRRWRRKNRNRSSKMRAIIAQRMVESMQISPHVHIVYKVDMTRMFGFVSGIRRASSSCTA